MVVSRGTGSVTALIPILKGQRLQAIMRREGDAGREVRVGQVMWGGRTAPRGAALRQREGGALGTRVARTSGFVLMSDDFGALLPVDHHEIVAGCMARQTPR